MAKLAELKKIACDAIDKEREHLKFVSQQIWEKPELAYQEHHAHQLLTEFLKKRGFQVTENYHLETAFKAEAGSLNKPHVGVMCEYDALPEIGHACGHNLIAEVGLAAGIGLKAVLDGVGKNLGKVTVLGCPAEEDGGGKVDLIKAGAYNDMDIAMMAHPGNFNASSTLILAMTEVVVTYKGKASHAAGFPWDGVNALDAAVMAYTNVSCLRQQMKPSWRVHGIITNGGAKPNIIPEESQLHYYIRTPTEGELQLLIQKMKACFDSAATATGCQVLYKWDPKPYHNMLFNKLLEGKYRTNCKAMGVAFTTEKLYLEQPDGSTDMGNVSHIVPAIHPTYDIGCAESCHSRFFTQYAGLDEAHEATIVQGKALAMTALDVLSESSLLTEIKAQFQEDLRKDALTV